MPGARWCRGPWAARAGGTWVRPAWGPKFYFRGDPTCITPLAALFQAEQVVGDQPSDGGFRRYRTCVQLSTLMVTPSKDSRGLRKGIDADDGRRRREASTVQLRKDKKEDGLQKRRRNAGGAMEVQLQPHQADVAARAPDVPDPGLAETLKSLPEDVRLLQSTARGKQVCRPATAKAASGAGSFCPGEASGVALGWPPSPAAGFWSSRGGLGETGTTAGPLVRPSDAAYALAPSLPQAHRRPRPHAHSWRRASGCASSSRSSGTRRLPR